MTRNLLFTRSSKAFLTGVAFAVLSIASIQASHAGCGKYGPPSKSAIDWRLPSSTGSPRFIRADYRADYRLVDDDWSGWQEHAKPPITGLWYFKYLSKGNTGITDGATLDEGNTIWFADGNEMTSSAMRAPIRAAFASAPGGEPASAPMSSITSGFRGTRSTMSPPVPRSLSNSSPWNRVPTSTPAW
jgi:hypothetical protein